MTHELCFMGLTGDMTIKMMSLQLIKTVTIFVIIIILFIHCKYIVMW